MNDPASFQPRNCLLRTSRFYVEEVTQQTETGVARKREIIRHPGAVVILPILDDGRVCLIRTYRVAVDQTLIELPAGTLAPGEDPLEGARRELAEETGYRAADFRSISRFYPSPGILDEQMHLYVATRLIAGEPNREPGEEIENLPVHMDDALKMIGEGTIKDGKTIVGLLLWSNEKGPADTQR
jgi:ADP-ribose pyrophosphatase